MAEAKSHMMPVGVVDPMANVPAEPAVELPAVKVDMSAEVAGPAPARETTHESRIATLEKSVENFFGLNGEKKQHGDRIADLQVRLDALAARVSVLEAALAPHGVDSTGIPKVVA